MEKQKSKELSYADIAKKKWGEVIRLKNKQGSRKTRKVVTKKLNLSDMEVESTGLRLAKDGGIIKCKAKDEIEKIKKVAKRFLERN